MIITRREMQQAGGVKQEVDPSRITTLDKLWRITLVRTAMEASGKTQRGLAVHLGITRVQVCRWLSGVRPVPSDQVMELIALVEGPGSSCEVAVMRRDTILCLCDLTGTMAQPWIDAGYRAILVDPQHADGVTVEGATTKVGHIIDHPETWRVIRENADRIAFVAGFAPCTDLAVSGSRWFKAKEAADPAYQFKAMQVVWQCHNIAEMTGAPYFIENPVSRISTLWRKPDYSFHPHHFSAFEPADNYTKLTMLWTGGDFKMPSKAQGVFTDKPDDRIHKAPPGAERANFRSATPRGFAQAVFEANK